VLLGLTAQMRTRLGFDPDTMLADENHIDDLRDDMTTTEVAETYGITDATVRQTIARGAVTARKSGGIWLIRRIDAEEHWGQLAEHT
jgi:excisionase family DNA binding protein